jgi:hypothetical protein
MHRMYDMSHILFTNSAPHQWVKHILHVWYMSNILFTNSSSIKRTVIPTYVSIHYMYNTCHMFDLPTLILPIHLNCYVSIHHMCGVCFVTTQHISYLMTWVYVQHIHVSQVCMFIYMCHTLHTYKKLGIYIYIYIYIYVCLYIYYIYIDIYMYVCTNTHVHINHETTWFYVSHIHSLYMQTIRHICMYVNLCLCIHHIRNV